MVFDHGTPRLLPVVSAREPVRRKLHDTGEIDGGDAGYDEYGAHDCGVDGTLA